MANYFDQFDEAPAQGGNYFDRFDAPATSAPAPSWLEGAKQAAKGYATGGLYGALKGAFQGSGADPMDMIRALPRSAGFAARSAVDAAVTAPGVMADGTMAAWNLATGQNNQMPSQAFGNLLPLPKAETTTEKIASAVMSAVAGSKIPMPTFGKQAPRDFVAPLNSEQQTLAPFREQGYVVPPSLVKPNAGNYIAESIGGKAAVKQLASVKNQRVTNDLIAEDLGLPKGARITLDKLQSLRADAGKVYADVEKIGAEIATDGQYVDDLTKISQPSQEILADFPDANVGKSEEVQNLLQSLLRDRFSTRGALAYMKDLRKQASANLSPLNSADPSKRALGYAQRDAAAALEDMVMRNLAAKGRGDLAEKFDAARTLIAKTHSAEAALNPDTGNVAARGLASQLKKGKPLSGGFETAGRFGRAFGEVANANLQSPGVSNLDAAFTAGGGIVGGLMGGPTTAAAALAWPLARLTARHGVLSSAAQNGLLAPAMGPVDPRYLTGAAAGARGLLGY